MSTARSSHRPARRRTRRWAADVLERGRARWRSHCRDGDSAALAYAALTVLVPAATFASAIAMPEVVAWTELSTRTIMLGAGISAIVGAIYASARSACTLELVLAAPSRPPGVVRIATGVLGWLVLAVALDLGVVGGWTLAPVAATLIVLASAVWFGSGPARMPAGDLAQATTVTSTSLIVVTLCAHALQSVLTPLPLAVLALASFPMVIAHALLLGASITAEVRERRQDAVQEQRSLESLHALTD